MGEATEFLPIKVIAPEMQADIQELLTPIFEDYHRVMVRDFDCSFMFIERSIFLSMLEGSIGIRTRTKITQVRSMGVFLNVIIE